MSIVLPALGIVFAAFCIWLVVRIVNRRERWAKWTLAAAVSLPWLYLVSFGPACWITSQIYIPGEQITTNPGLVIYSPLAEALRNDPESRFSFFLLRWMTLGIPNGRRAIVPLDSSRKTSVMIDPADL
jgi:hypothetical protein